MIDFKFKTTPFTRFSLITGIKLVAAGLAMILGFKVNVMTQIARDELLAAIEEKHPGR
nr:hypothetical protein SUGSMm_09600 [Morganella morganii subsp. sibonii]